MAGGPAAGADALDLFKREEAVRGDALVADAELGLAVVEDLVAAAQHAGDVGADLDVVLAGRDGAQHGVVGEDVADVELEEVEAGGDLVDRGLGDVADLVLRVEQHGDEGGALDGVEGNEVVEAGGKLRGKDCVGDCAHGCIISRARRSAARSISSVHRPYLNSSVFFERERFGVALGVGEGGGGELKCAGVDAEKDVVRAYFDDGVVGGGEAVQGGVGAEEGGPGGPELGVEFGGSSGESGELRRESTGRLREGTSHLRAAKGIDCRQGSERPAASPEKPDASDLRVPTRPAAPAEGRSSCARTTTSANEVQAQRSISPRTMSMDPMTATTSARRRPLHMVSRAWRVA